VKPLAYARIWVRESRGGLARLLFFGACLALGVAAVVAVAGFTQALREGVRREARALLAADLVVSGRNGLAEEIDAELASRPGLVVTRSRELSTMVSVPPDETSNTGPGPSLLVQLKALDGPYPHYGELVLDPPLAPGESLGQRLGADGAVVGPELAERLGVALGDAIAIGGERFRVRGRVLEEPDRSGFGMFFGPRVFVSGAGLDRTPLEGFGSRVNHRRLVRMPEGTTGAEVSRLERDLEQIERETGVNIRVRNRADDSPGLGRGFERVESFLGLVALLSLWIGGLGVAQAVRSWISGRMQAVAVQKCLGMRPREVLASYLGQVAVLGFLASAFGAALGVAVQVVVPPLLEGLLPVDALDPWQPLAILRGLLLGAGVAFFFSVVPLVGVLAVPPARVLRSDAEPLPTSRGVRVVAGLVLAAGVLATAAVQADSLWLGAQFTGGMAIVALVLVAGARGVMWLVSRMPRTAVRSVALRHGLAALGRPGSGTVGAVVAQGVGVVVVLAMFLVESQLSHELTTAVPDDAPSAFLVDIQPHQWEGVRALLDEEGGRNVVAAPVVTARLSAIDGRAVAEIARERQQDARGGRPTWVLTREQRLTWMDELPEDNRVVTGELWGRPDEWEASLEQDFAEDLGVGLGALLEFDVQGVPVELRVTSIRTVEWRTFGINFFVVVEPGSLEGAPGYRVATVQVPEGREARVQDRLAAAYPNVTLLDVRDLLERVVAILEQVGLGVRALGGFTVVAGILILFGAIGTSSLRRGRETALLKTIGLTRGGVATLYAVEYALVGLLAGVVGSVGGTALAWGVVTQGLELTWRTDPVPLLVAVLASVALSVAAGVGASLRALAQRPLAALRAE
jgi:putative ABC transport system permease protein